MSYDICPRCEQPDFRCLCPEPDGDGDEGFRIECDFCDGTGQTSAAFDVNGRLSFDCPECGGTGWF